MSNAATIAPIQPRLLTIKEAATALRLSRSTIYQLIGNKQLEVVKIGRSTRVPASRIDEAVERFRQNQVAEQK